ncbi:hypothetical protein [Chryseobacterium luteum]|uniref:hypothetical protein n=1 Tax=Chryseobacterium luteum TaxID=421531 RepID=UPI00373FE26B
MQAVYLSEQRGNVSLVAQELGICKESLVNWRKLHKEGKLTISSDTINNLLLQCSLLDKQHFRIADVLAT